MSLETLRHATVAGRSTCTPEAEAELKAEAGSEVEVEAEAEVEVGAEVEAEARLGAGPRCASCVLNTGWQHDSMTGDPGPRGSEQ